MSYFWMAVRKKDMANKPVKNVFFSEQNLVLSFYVCKLSSIQMGSFISCIQMNADTYGMPQNEK